MKKHDLEELEDDMELGALAEEMINTEYFKEHLRPRLERTRDIYYDKMLSISVDSCNDFSQVGYLYSHYKLNYEAYKNLVDEIDDSVKVGKRSRMEYNRLHDNGKL